MPERKVRIYVCRGMSGRNQAEVVKEASQDKDFYEAAGLEVLCPVEKEHIKPENKPLVGSKALMDVYWFQDKAFIRQADVVIDATPHLLSQGVMHEIGLARYGYWKPVVRVFPCEKLPKDGNVAYYEDDVVVDEKLLAVEAIYRLYGTRQKRLMWRLKLINRCLPKWIVYQFCFLFELKTRGFNNVKTS